MYYDCKYGYASYYLYDFYDYLYYETLTEEQEKWAEVIDANYYDISQALDDLSVGYDANGVVKKRGDLTCYSFYNYGINDAVFTDDICGWLLGIIAEPVCYWDQMYDEDIWDPENSLSCSEMLEL